MFLSLLIPTKVTITKIHHLISSRFERSEHKKSQCARMHILEICKHFFPKSCHRQTHQNYEQSLQRLQNSYFQSHFSVSKINRIFLNYFSAKNIRVQDQLWKMKTLKTLKFKVLCLLEMCRIFVSSVHNFGRTDDEMM